MKIKFIFLMIICCVIAHAEEPMKKFGLIQHFESFFEAMKPAEENNEEAFAWFSGLPHPMYNSITHLSSDKQNVSKEVDRLIDKAPTNTPISFWVHPENRADGLVEVLK